MINELYAKLREEQDPFKPMDAETKKDIQKNLTRKEMEDAIINKRFEMMDDHDQNPQDSLEWIWREGSRMTPFSKLSDEEIKAEYSEAVMGDDDFDDDEEEDQ